MKCYSAAIRTVCLVLSVQIVALSDAKSIGPSSLLSLHTNNTTANNNSSSSQTHRTGDSVERAAAAAAAAATPDGRSNGANDPPPPAGQERHQSRRIPETNASHFNSSSRFIKYVPKYSIDHLLDHFYEFKISNDIDLDPCKTGNYNPRSVT